MLVSAPAYILALLFFNQGQIYAWSKIIGTAFLFAVYAYLFTDNRVKGGWLYVLGFHAVCAVILGLMVLKG